MIGTKESLGVGCRCIEIIITIIAIAFKIFNITNEFEKVFDGWAPDLRIDSNFLKSRILNG